MVRKLSVKRRTFKKSLSKRYKRTKGYKRTKKNTLKRRVSKRNTLRRKSFRGGRPRATTLGLSNTRFSAQNTRYSSDLQVKLRTIDQLVENIRRYQLESNFRENVEFKRDLQALEIKVNNLLRKRALGQHIQDEQELERGQEILEELSARQPQRPAAPAPRPAAPAPRPAAPAPRPADAASPRQTMHRDVTRTRLISALRGAVVDDKKQEILRSLFDIEEINFIPEGKTKETLYINRIFDTEKEFSNKTRNDNISVLIELFYKISEQGKIYKILFPYITTISNINNFQKCGWWNRMDESTTKDQCRTQRKTSLINKELNDKEGNVLKFALTLLYSYISALQRH